MGQPTRYKLYDIEWDTDDDLAADEELPKFAFMDDYDGTSLEDLRNGAAADWLSDKYGFCVKSLKVDKTDEQMFTVFVRRVETYDLPVNVLAKSKEEAEKKVKEQDSYDGGDKFVEYWNELQPSVKTTYDAEESECPERGGRANGMIYERRNFKAVKRRALDGKDWWVPFDVTIMDFSKWTCHGKYRTRKECQYAIDHPSGMGGKKCSTT